MNILKEINEHLENSKLLFDFIPEIVEFSNIIIKTLNSNNKILNSSIKWEKKLNHL